MKKSQLLRGTLVVLGGAAALWIGAVFLLPVLLPFVIALVIARLVQPAVRVLERRLPRWLAAGAAVFGLLALLGLAIFLLGRCLVAELSRFVRELPLLLQSLAQPMAALRSRLEALAARAPDFLSGALRESVDGFFENGSVLIEKSSAKLFSLVSGLIAALPDLFLFIVTAILATFMLCSRYDSLCDLCRRKLPAKWRNKYQTFAESLRQALSGWLKAQCKLIGVNFLLLTMGLMLLNVEFPFLFGALIALIDALPVLGTGTVLIPWGLLSFLRGSVRRGTGLLLLYGAACLTRTTLEPRLVGRQAGLDPIWTLLALYAGYRLMGVGGMILFPIGAILLKQLWTRAILHEPPR